MLKLEFLLNENIIIKFDKNKQRVCLEIDDFEFYLYPNNKTKLENNNIIYCGDDLPIYDNIKDDEFVTKSFSVTFDSNYLATALDTIGKKTFDAGEVTCEKTHRNETNALLFDHVRDKFQQWLDEM